MNNIKIQREKIHPKESYELKNLEWLKIKLYKENHRLYRENKHLKQEIEAKNTSKLKKIFKKLNLWYD